MNPLLESLGYCFLWACGLGFIALIFWSASGTHPVAFVLSIVLGGFSLALLIFCLGFVLALIDQAWTEFKTLADSNH